MRSSSTKQEVPVRIVKHSDRKHRTESRIFQRDIWENYCTQVGCRFFGKRAVQGVCHTTAPFAEGTSWDYVDKVEKAAHESLAEMRRMFKNKPRSEYIRYLESMHVCEQMNTIFSLDELVRLRARLAVLPAVEAERKLRLREAAR